MHARTDMRDDVWWSSLTSQCLRKGSADKGQCSCVPAGISGTRELCQLSELISVMGPDVSAVPQAKEIGSVAVCLKWSWNSTAGLWCAKDSIPSWEAAGLGSH